MMLRHCLIVARDGRGRRGPSLSAVTGEAKVRRPFGRKRSWRRGLSPVTGDNGLRSGPLGRSPLTGDGSTEPSTRARRRGDGGDQTRAG